MTPLLWVHGGGFVAGGLDQKESDAPARYLAATGRWVRTLDYRLAPNIGLFGQPRPGPAPGRFPAAHHDVIDAARALCFESGGPIDLGGASAGANLAAGATVGLRDAGDDILRSLVLAYGVLHAQLPENGSVESNLHGILARWFFNPGMTKRMNLNYVGSEAGMSDPNAFPGSANLQGFPPTLTLDALNDRLRKSGHAFHQQLERAGVTAREEVVDGRHGFLGAPNRPPFSIGMGTINGWLDDLDYQTPRASKHSATPPSPAAANSPKKSPKSSDSSHRPAPATSQEQ